MTYEHPLAYVLGLEGVALLRAFTGEYDREFVETRLAEIRHLLEGPQRPAATEVGPWDLWPWCLADLVPDAAKARTLACRAW